MILRASSFRIPAIESAHNSIYWLPAAFSCCKKLKKAGYSAPLLWLDKAKGKTLSFYGPIGNVVWSGEQAEDEDSDSEDATLYR